MKHLLALPATLLLCTPAFADTTDDRLHEIEHFFENAVVLAGPTIVDCKLSGGTEAQCFSITVKAEPQDYTPGPWCPTSITDDASKGGIWLDQGEVLDVDGTFITSLSTLYGDENWQLYNEETGEIRVTDTQASCEAAARPDVDPEYNNYCVQCLPEYMDEDASMTYVIPLEPHDSAETTRPNTSGSGIAHNGVRLDGPAPVDAILSAYTVAPFDDCGGHVNTHVGYHYHAVTDCLDQPAAAGNDAAQVGIAMDGYAIFTHLLSDGTEPVGLDECNGHTSEDGDYHYHAGAAGTNAILSCLKAEVGCSSEDPDAVCDASARRPRP
jgi:hypothetical protein